MSELRASSPCAARKSAGAAARDKVLIAVLILAATAGDACADARPQLGGAKDDADSGARPRVLKAPRPGRLPAIGADLYSVPADAALPRFSATEFRPRKRTLFDPDPACVYAETPMLRGTTLWQRLGDYRTRDGVRLLTLWEAGGGAVSLQAGKHGDPSLQWNSTSLNRGGARRGLLDRLFSASIAGAEETLQNMTRGAAQTARRVKSGPVTAGVADIHK